MNIDPNIETTHAYLPLEGTRRATLHRYSHSAIITRGCGTCLGHFFRCTETGAVRLWGVSAVYGEGN